MPAIGIDLGTSNSCVAVYRNNQNHVIANDGGSRLTPSFVSFTEDERLVGDAAKSSLSSNFENTIFPIKRLIGRTYDDPIVQSDMKTIEYDVVNDKNKPIVCVAYRKQFFTPEEISAMILESLKQTAEDYLGEPVTDAVITVPAHFNDAQRGATRDAGIIAGLNVLRMINEPTAAAIAYGIETNDKQNILIFDLGGGTFDVSIVNIEDKVFDVRATGGDTHLGGNDFDNRLTEHFVKEFNKANKCDMSQDKRALSRLRVNCEMAKRQLSSSAKTRVNIDALYNGKDWKSDITRATFEQLNRDLFNKTIQIVEKTISDAGMTTLEIDNVVIVGGSTRIPKIQQLLKKLFGGKVIDKKINADEAVAYGAGAFAAKLADDTQFMSDFKEIDLRDVLPQSIGWESLGGGMNIVLQRNTNIPIIETVHGLTTAEDNQTSVSFIKKEAEKLRKEDEEWKARNRARNDLEDFVYAIKHSVDDPDFIHEMLMHDKKLMLEKCTEILEWTNIKGIDNVVIVGGSTRIPKIQQLLKKLFGGKVMDKKINAYEAVAYGAGAFAAKLADDTQFMSDLAIENNIFMAFPNAT
uniref:heat shock 70 kDa protein II-like n=1 Tax=Styela clava TaxID=7725 RepID=UPI00193A7AE3|nr:heat shock 70 kDa protein II-like [Styela clava]